VSPDYHGDPLPGRASSPRKKIKPPGGRGQKSRGERLTKPTQRWPLKEENSGWLARPLSQSRSLSPIGFSREKKCKKGESKEAIIPIKMRKSSEKSEPDIFMSRWKTRRIYREKKKPKFGEQTAPLLEEKKKKNLLSVLMGSRKTNGVDGAQPGRAHGRKGSNQDQLEKRKNLGKGSPNFAKNRENRKKRG